MLLLILHSKRIGQSTFIICIFPFQYQKLPEHDWLTNTFFIQKPFAHCQNQSELVEASLTNGGSMPEPGIANDLFTPDAKGMRTTSILTWNAQLSVGMQTVIDCS